MKINTTEIDQPDFAWLEDLVSDLQDAWNDGDPDDIEAALKEFGGVVLDMAGYINDVLKRNGVKSG